MSVREVQQFRYAFPTKMSGFTMVELAVVLVIALVLAAIGIPQYNTAMDTQKTSLRANALMADMDYARSEAVKEGQNITICSSSDGASCAGTTNWNSGWITYTTDSKGNVVVLRKQQSFKEKLTTNPAISSLTYNDNGFALNVPAGTGQLFTAYTADLNSSAVRCVWLDSLGRSQIQSTSSTFVSGQTQCTTPSS